MADNTNAMIVTSLANEILNKYFYPRTDVNNTRRIWIGLGLSDSVLDKHESTMNFKEPSTLNDPEAEETNAYKRVELTQNLMNSATGGQIENKDIIFFPETQLDGWGTVAYFGLFTSDSSTAKPFFWAKLTDKDGNPTAIQIPGQDSAGNGYIPIFRADALRITLDRAPFKKEAGQTYD